MLVVASRFKFKVITEKVILHLVSSHHCSILWLEESML